MMPQHYSNVEELPKRTVLGKPAWQDLRGFARGGSKVCDAVFRAVQFIAPLPTEEIDIMHSLGRVLQENICSQGPLPPFAKSLVDGYAVRRFDVMGGSRERPKRLTVKGVIPAGCGERASIGPGETYRIMTGAPVPKGADLIVKMERVSVSGDTITVGRSAFANDHICRQGEDLAAGLPVLQRGRRISPTAMGLLSACGRRCVRVSQIPVVGIASTGNELAEPGGCCGRGEIYEISSHLLAGLVRQTGADPLFLGICKDREQAVCRLLAQNDDCNVLIVTGGCGTGDHDRVRPVFDKLGIDNIFKAYVEETGCRIFMGKRNGQLLFGLPGNPAAAMINYLFFVRPVLDHMMGSAQVGLEAGAAEITANWTRRQRRNELYCATLERIDGRLGIRLLPWQRFGLYFPLLDMDAVAEIPRSVDALRAGDRVTVFFVDRTLRERTACGERIGRNNHDLRLVGK